MIEQVFDHDLKKTFARETVELAVMGVHKEGHRKGLSRGLL